MLTTILACFPRNDAVVLVQSTPLLRRATVPRSGPGPRNNRQSILYVNRIVRTLPTTAIPARNPAPHRIADSPRPEAQKRRDHYNDLGATIIGPAADLNLGIKTFLNGALVSDIVLDTSTTTTDTID